MKDLSVSQGYLICTLNENGTLLTLSTESSVCLLVRLNGLKVFKEFYSSKVYEIKKRPYRNEEGTVVGNTIKSAGNNIHSHTLLDKASNSQMKRISLEEIKSIYKIEDYARLTECVQELMNMGKLKPIKASKTNGKTPALFNRYHIIRPEIDTSDYLEELEFKLSPKLDNAYYLKNPARYQKDRMQVLALNQYLKNGQGADHDAISLNERSFEIWGREKYLKEEGAVTLLRNLKFPIENLNIYETAEPLSYYPHHKKTPQSVLIIENKDTFFSMRKYLLEHQQLPEQNQSLLGVLIGTLIYGSGKAILKAMTEFETCVEPYICNPENEILYFGDIDYEGILIYERLQELIGCRYKIRPFVRAYEKMLEKAANLDCLPKTKDGQNKNIKEVFMNHFEEPVKEIMSSLLKAGKYIPQEILNRADFADNESE